MTADVAVPLISVVMPCYNAAPYLAEAIESVLRQDAGPIEIIIVDDGSTDDSAAVARRFGAAVRVEQQANTGIAAARNRGVALACAPYLAFLDSDDVWPEGSLRLRLDCLLSNLGIECVFGALAEFVSPDLDAEAKARLRPAPAAMRARFAGSMLIRRGSFLRVGPFDANLKIGETLDWVARAEDAGVAMRALDAVVLLRRLHGTNTVTREAARQGDYLRALRASLVRRRGAGALKAD